MTSIRPPASRPVEIIAHVSPDKKQSHFEQTWATYPVHYLRLKDFTDYWTCRQHEVGDDLAKKEYAACTHKWKDYLDGLKQHFEAAKGLIVCKP